MEGGLSGRRVLRVEGGGVLGGWRVRDSRGHQPRAVVDAPSRTLLAAVGGHGGDVGASQRTRVHGEDGLAARTGCAGEGHAVWRRVDAGLRQRHDP